MTTSNIWCIPYTYLGYDYEKRVEKEMRYEVELRADGEEADTICSCCGSGVALNDEPLTNTWGITVAVDHPDPEFEDECNKHVKVQTQNGVLSIVMRVNAPYECSPNEYTEDEEYDDGVPW